MRTKRFKKIYIFFKIDDTQFEPKYFIQRVNLNWLKSTGNFWTFSSNLQADPGVMHIDLTLRLIFMTDRIIIISKDSLSNTINKTSANFW